MYNILTCFEDIEGGEKQALLALDSALQKIITKKFTFLNKSYKQIFSKGFSYYFVHSVYFWLGTFHNQKADLFIFTDAQQFLAYFLLRRKTPVIFYFHGNKFFSFKKILNKEKRNILKIFLGAFWTILYNRLLVLLIFHSKIIFVPNIATKKLLLKNFAKLKNRAIEIIPNGVDQKKFRAISQIKKNRIKNDFKIQKNTFILTYIGRVDRIKNIDMVLLSLKKFSDSICFYIVYPAISQADQRQYLQYLSSLAEKLGLKNVYFSESNFQMIHNWYQLSDCIILPSSVEQSSMVIKESLACGIPIISSDTGDAETLLKYLGEKFILRSVSKNSIEESLRFTLSINASERKLLNYKMKELIKKFSWDKSAKIFYKKIEQFAYTYESI